MARDWGLCYTALDNLEIAEDLLAGWDIGQAWSPCPPPSAWRSSGSGSSWRRNHVRWKARARLGTRVRWYEDVGDAQQQGQGDAGIRER